MSTESAARPAGTATNRRRRTLAAAGIAARRMLARKGIPATTIAADAGRSAASCHRYHGSETAVVRRWALRFRGAADERARAAETRDIPTRLIGDYRAVYCPEDRIQ